MQFDPDDRGVEAWEFSTPSVLEAEGERIPFDERSTVEIQMEIDRLLTTDKRQRGMWSLGVIGLLLFFLIAPGDVGTLVSAIVLAASLPAAFGFMRVRRRQLRESLEGELEARRLEELESEQDSAFRLAALRDELDRREHDGRRWGQIGVGVLATVFTIGFGLAEATQLLTALGGFFGLATLLAVNEERQRIAEESALRTEVRAIEDRRSPSHE